MTTFGYTERPLGLTGPARNTVNERATPVQGGHDDNGALAVRGESTAKRIRNRPHHNEAPARPAVPGGNAKPAGGRVAAPARPTMPAQSRRVDDTPATTDPSAGETAVLPAVPAAAAPAGSGSTTGFPSRPDPSDPATEVWALVERAQAGEAEAFGLIYDRYVDTVFRFVYFRVGNRQLAEDLTSDTFLRALKRIGSFTWQGRDLGAWLVTIARNLVADHFKSGRYRLEVTTGDVLDADREDRGPEGSPEAAVVEHITNVALLSAVKQLNPEQQECIVLRFLQGFSVAETARAMGKNEGAIKALQYRAVRALARLLPDGFQP
ncbi:sigma-70 family RNA polymerase sigma factor [Micromonospora globbae]|uniref:Sigma-70 family RNA polymerase sigma factor n=1 Tax=Micromonospora globbae TaxID=1894969 RepID=A0ABZ1S5Y4_9ACTN|nr:ECF subfamily RNA polymerase sigma factor, BldN family [Micromonospora globbae]